MGDVPAGLMAFLAALQACDAASAADQLAEYVILESPIDVDPFVGREQVVTVIAQMLDVFELFTITHIIAENQDFAVVTNIRFGDTEIDGIGLIGIDGGGKVASLAIHLRPMRAVVALRNRLAPATGLPLLTLTEES